eukprot:2327891-Prymnesium_polylepis.1
MYSGDRHPTRASARCHLYRSFAWRSTSGRVARVRPPSRVRPICAAAGSAAPRSMSARCAVRSSSMA